MHELKDDNFQQILDENKKVLVQYGAGWCGNCRMLKPKFRKMAESHDGIAFVYIDAEKNPGARSFADVSNLPTFAAFSKGKLVDQKQGNKISFVEELVDALTAN